MNRFFITRLVSIATLAVLSSCRDDTTGTTNAPPPRDAAAEGFTTRGEVRTGWVIGRDGAPLQITFEVHDGRAILEGDIELGAAANIPATREGLLVVEPVLRPQLGVVIDGALCNPVCGSRHWPQGVVYYTIDPGVPIQTRVTDAMAHIRANNPGVVFLPRQSINPDYVWIIQSDQCSSYVGRVGGAQLLKLADTCSTGSTIHELLHALGMGHEQSRCDRDTFVQILLQNVEPGYEHNFDKLCDGYEDALAYAEGSIMHYPPNAFSINGQPTIQSLRGLDYLMGQRDGEGTSDIQTVDLMYPRPPVMTVWIGGKQNIALHESAQYTANASGGTPPRTYQWRSRVRVFGSWGAWSGWYSTGAQNYTFASVNSCNTNAIDLQVLVTDAADNTATQTGVNQPPYPINITNPC